MSFPGESPNVSSTAQYSPCATEIITAAFRHAAIIDDEEAPTPAMMRTGMKGLNVLMKELEATGIHIWTEEEAILFLQQNQTRYLLGGPPSNPSPDHATDAYEWSLLQLTAASAQGAMGLTASLTFGVPLADGDQIGVVTNNGNAFWTTIGSFTGFTSALPSGNITLAAPLPAACNTGNLAFVYTTPLLRPLRVPFARRLQYAMGAQQGGIITPLSPMLSRQSYHDLPQPRTPGTVTQAYYNPARDQGQFFVWPNPMNANNGIRFTYYRPMFNFLSLDNTADLPDEWTNTLEWNLAKWFRLDYSIPAARQAEIKEEAARTLDIVMSWDREPESIYMGRASPERRW